MDDRSTGTRQEIPEFSDTQHGARAPNRYSHSFAPVTQPSSSSVGSTPPLINTRIGWLGTVNEAVAQQEQGIEERANVATVVDVGRIRVLYTDGTIGVLVSSSGADLNPSLVAA